MRRGLGSLTRSRPRNHFKEEVIKMRRRKTMREQDRPKKTVRRERFEINEGKALTGDTNKIATPLQNLSLT
jgi:hypothetical protein